MEPAFSDFLFSGKAREEESEVCPMPATALSHSSNTNHCRQRADAVDFRCCSMWLICSCHLPPCKGKTKYMAWTILKGVLPIAEGWESHLWPQEYRGKPNNEFRSIQYPYRTLFPGEKLGRGRGQLIKGFTTAQSYQLRTHHYEVMSQKAMDWHPDDKALD